eukprot:3701790-Prymnesium_polylepis.1
MLALQKGRQDDQDLGVRQRQARRRRSHAQANRALHVDPAGGRLAVGVGCRRPVRRAGWGAVD